MCIYVCIYTHALMYRQRSRKTAFYKTKTAASAFFAKKNKARQLSLPQKPRCPTGGPRADPPRRSRPGRGCGNRAREPRARDPAPMFVMGRPFQAAFAIGELISGRQPPTHLPDCSAAGAPPAGRAHPALRLRAPRQGRHPTDDDDEAGSTQIAPEQKPPCAKAPKKK